MNNDLENYFDIIRVLDTFYGNLKNTNLVRNLVAKYISEKGVNASDIKCEIVEEHPKVLLNDGSEILYQGNPDSLIQMAISKQTNTQKIWTIIDFPPNPSAKPFTDSTLPYTPKIDSFCIDETGIYHTSFTPYKKIENTIVYEPTAPLKTTFYSNEKLSANNVSKTFENIAMNLNKINADDTYETNIDYALVYDPSGMNTIDFNMIQAAIKIEETYQKEKTTIPKI